MNAKKLLSSLLFLFIIFISPANAQEGFTATSLRSVDLCPCSNQAYTITVENTGTTTSSYRVIAGEATRDWATFSPDRFVLNPRQRGAFSVIVNSACNIEGDFDSEIFVATDSGLAKVVKQTIKFSQCYDYSLEEGKVADIDEKIEFSGLEGHYLLCKNEQRTIPIKIQNNENFGNIYTLLLDAPEWAKLSVDKVQLEGKKSGIFLINFDTTNIEGEFNFKLNAISELGEVQRKKNIEVNVEECYALQVDFEKEKDTVCGGEDKNYDIILENSGTLEQVIDLGLDAPEWADFGNISLIELESGEREIVTLNVEPGDDVSGKFLIKVSATPEDKEITFSDDIELDITSKEACYKADISTKEVVNNFYYEDLILIEVKNSGVKKAAYNVILESESWVSVRPKTLELNPGQTGTLNLILNPDADIEPGSYSLTINLESNDVTYSKDVDIMLKKENEFVKGLKINARLYQYYIYLLIIVVVLFIIFKKSIIRFKTNTEKRYEKYKVKRERLRASKLARKERKEEKEKEAEKRNKKPKKTKKAKKSKFNKIWIYGLLIIAALIFIGHQNRLFNAKYLHIYIRNIFVGYFYYILIGFGVVIAMFLLILFYNYANKQGNASNQVSKKSKSKRKKWLKGTYIRIIVAVLIAILIFIANNPDFNTIRDFFILYQYYFVSGTVILIVVILLIRFYKPLFKFLKE